MSLFTSINQYENVFPTFQICQWEAGTGPTNLQTKFLAFLFLQSTIFND